MEEFTKNKQYNASGGVTSFTVCEPRLPFAKGVDDIIYSSALAILFIWSIFSSGAAKVHIFTGACSRL